MTRNDQKLYFMANPAMNRELETEGMVEEGMLSIIHDKNFSKMLLFDPMASFLWADAVLTITFPDPLLLELGKVGDRDRAAVLRVQQNKVLGAIDAATNYLKTTYEFAHPFDDFKHEFKITRSMGEAEAKGEELVEVVKLSVTLFDTRSIAMLREMLNKFLEADAIQLSHEVRLAVTARGNIGKVKIVAELFDGKAARRPISTWLTLEHKAEVLQFFSIPEVAAMVAEGCKGKRVQADKMNKAAAVQKRANFSGDNPITIMTVDDVPRIVDDFDFGAFYPWIERMDGQIARLVCDPDMGRAFVGLLGPSRAWAACCAMTDAIVRAGVALGLPMPARLFSGSRGIHVVWDVDPEAFQLGGDDGSIVLPGYRLAVLAVEPKAEYLTSLDPYIHKPKFASKLFLEAVVLHAMHTQMAAGAVLDNGGRASLGITRDSSTCTLDRKDMHYPNKVTVDCQPVVHRWLSPHHKSGRITRSVVDETGSVRPEFRELARVQQESELWYAAGDIPKRPERYAPHPGYVPEATIEALVEARQLGATIAMLLGEGIVPCCTMPAERYVELHSYYVGFLEQKKEEMSG